MIAPRFLVPRVYSLHLIVCFRQQKTQNIRLHTTSDREVKVCDAANNNINKNIQI